MPTILFAPMLPAVLALVVFALFVGFVVFIGIRAPKGKRLWPTLRRLLIAAALLAMVLRPGVPGLGDRTTVATGNDVFIVFDTTGSVAAEDYGDGQTRLSGMKADVAKILKDLAGSKFALLTFDVVALTRVPLTTDSSAVQSAVDVLSPEVTLYSHGTSISEAKDLLISSLQQDAAEHPERQRIVIYLGDGEQNSGEEPDTFADAASLIVGGGVLGYGTEAGGRMLENPGPIPQIDADGDGVSDSPEPEQKYIEDRSTSPFSEAISKIDEDNLKDIASQLGVSYLHRTSDTPVEATVTTVPDLPDTIETPVRTIIELYWVAGLIAFALLLWEAGIIVLALLGIRRPRRADEPRPDAPRQS